MCSSTAPKRQPGRYLVDTRGSRVKSDQPSSEASERLGRYHKLSLNSPFALSKGMQLWNQGVFAAGCCKNFWLSPQRVPGVEAILGYEGWCGANCLLDFGAEVFVRYVGASKAAGECHYG